MAYFSFVIMIEEDFNHQNKRKMSLAHKNAITLVAWGDVLTVSEHKIWFHDPNH